MDEKLKQIAVRITDTAGNTLYIHGQCVLDADRYQVTGTINCAEIKDESKAVVKS